MTARAEAAHAELREALGALRLALDAARARRRTEKTADLQRQALGGVLGADMRTLAARVRAGATTWADVFDGTSPDVDLTHSHVARMAQVHGPLLREQVR
ncbi:MAG TPA: hypothetical protein VFQ17_05695 [Nocardioides sp.]|nr:hypothetical protein [Nocardioides sp.]